MNRYTCYLYFFKPLPDQRVWVSGAQKRRPLPCNRDPIACLCRGSRRFHSFYEIETLRGFNIREFPRGDRRALHRHEKASRVEATYEWHTRT